MADNRMMAWLVDHEWYEYLPVDRTSLLIFTLFILVYVFVRPLIKWMISIQAVCLLSYFSASFALILIVLIALQFNPDNVEFGYLKQLLQHASYWGILLFLFHLIGQIGRRRKLWKNVK